MNVENLYTTMLIGETWKVKGSLPEQGMMVRNTNKFISGTKLIYIHVDNI